MQIVLISLLWMSHAAIVIHSIDHEEDKCYQSSFQNEKCYGLEVLERLVCEYGDGGRKYSYGSCADKGYDSDCDGSNPELDTRYTSCGHHEDPLKTVYTYHSQTQCYKAKSCVKDWCGHDRVFDWDKKLSKTVSGGNIRITFRNTCRGIYETYVENLVNFGLECNSTDFYIGIDGVRVTYKESIQQYGCCIPATTAAPTVAPVPYFSEVMNKMTQETECREVNISPRCTAGILEMQHGVELGEFAPGSCINSSRNASYVDVTDLLSVPGAMGLSLGGCEHFEAPMTYALPMSLFYKEHPKPASGWYVEYTIYNHGDCTGNAQYTSFITSDYFGFGACKNVGTHDGVDMYEKVECTEDTIITQYYSDANCFVVASNAENFRAEFNSDGQCDKEGEVPGVYSKMIFSGACPAAGPPESFSDKVDRLRAWGEGIVYVGTVCQAEDEFLLANINKIQDCWEKCNMVDSSIASCFVERTEIWDLCHCQHSCDSVKTQHWATMYLKVNESLPAEIETIELPILTCTQLDTNYPNQYSYAACYCGRVRLSTYDNEDCQGLPKFEETISTTYSSRRSIAKEVRLAEPCDMERSVTLELRESKTGTLATFISLLLLWATL